MIHTIFSRIFCNFANMNYELDLEESNETNDKIQGW